MTWSRWSCGILFHKYAVHINAYLFYHCWRRHYRKFPFKSLWEQGYQFPRKTDIRFHKLLGTLHFKQKYKLYFICNINLRIDILLYVCFLHIKNHIWEFWWTCCQAGGVSYSQTCPRSHLY